MASRLDRLVDGVASHRQPPERDDRAGPVVLVHAVKLGDEALLDRLGVVEPALQHDLAVRRDGEAVGGPGHLDRLAEHYTVYAPQLPGTHPSDPHAIHKVETFAALLLMYEELVRALGGNPEKLRRRAGIRLHESGKSDAAALASWH